MSSVKVFEDLRIWQEARGLIKEIYSTFGVSSPAEKDYGFRDQVQRASVSIMNNIAEGFERNSDAEFARFLTIAKGSCGEVRSLLYTAQDLKYISDKDAEKLRDVSISISKGIYTLTKHLKNK